MMRSHVHSLEPALASGDLTASVAAEALILPRRIRGKRLFASLTIYISLLLHAAIIGFWIYSTRPRDLPKPSPAENVVNLDLVPPPEVKPPPPPPQAAPEPPKPEPPKPQPPKPEPPKASVPEPVTASQVPAPPTESKDAAREPPPPAEDDSRTRPPPSDTAPAPETAAKAPEPPPTPADARPEPPAPPAPPVTAAAPPAPPVAPQAPDGTISAPPQVPASIQSLPDLRPGIALTPAPQPQKPLVATPQRPARAPRQSADPFANTLRSALNTPLRELAPGAFTRHGDRDNYSGSVLARLQSYLQYPPGARSRGIGGRALVGFAIDGRGIVTQVALTQSTGNAELDAEAVAVVRRASPFPPPPPGEPRFFPAVIEFGQR